MPPNDNAKRSREQWIKTALCWWIWLCLLIQLYVDVSPRKHFGLKAPQLYLGAILLSLGYIIIQGIAYRLQFRNYQNIATQVRAYCETQRPTWMVEYIKNRDEGLRLEAIYKQEHQEKTETKIQTITLQHTHEF